MTAAQPTVTATTPLGYLDGALDADRIGDPAAAHRLINAAVKIAPTRADVYAVRNTWGPDLTPDDLIWLTGEVRARRATLDRLRGLSTSAAIGAVLGVVFTVNSASVAGVILGLVVLGVAVAAGLAYRIGTRAPQAQTWADLLVSVTDDPAAESWSLPDAGL